MPTIRLLSCCSLSCLLAAQAPAPAAPPPASLAAALAAGVPLHDEGTDPHHGPLGIWGAGADFKVGFHDGAFVLVPYLGASAPQSLPWQWRTLSATVDGRDLLAGGAAVERFDARRFERRRGLVTERWDLGRDAAEQAFLIEAPAAVPKGELRIRGQVTTPLLAAPRGPAVAPLRFDSEAVGYGLVYGTAAVFDAAGRSEPVPTSFDGEAITLHVPAAFVAAATWPLLVDPLLQPHGIVSGSSLAFGEFDLDALPGSAAAQALVWTRAASAADSDLYLFRCADDFTGAVLWGSEISASIDSVEPSLAGSDVDGTLTIAWARLYAIGDRCYVQSFAADAASASLASPILLTTQMGASERRPRAAAARRFSLSPDQALIVRMRTLNGVTEVVGTLFGTTTHNSGGTFAIASPNQWTGNLGEPSVSRSIRGDYEGWVVAFHYWSTTFARYQIGLKRVAYTGAVDSQGLSVNLTNPDRHAMRPRIDGTYGRHLVAFSTAPVSSYPGQLTSFPGTAIECQRIDWSASGGPRHAWPVRTVQTSPGRVLLVDGVAASTANHSHWLLGVRGGSSASVHLLGYRGLTIASEPLPGPSGSGTHVAQDVVVAYSPANDRFAAVYDFTSNYQGALTWSCTGIVRSYPDLPAPVFYGSSCGTSQPRLYHQFRIGNEFPTFGVPDLQSGQWALIGLSLAPGSLPFASLGVPGGCTLHLDPSPAALLATWPVFANSAGYASVQLPLPESLPPIDIYLQLLTAGSTPGTFAASRGARIAVR